MQELLDWIKSVGLGRLAWGTDVDLTMIEKNPNPNIVDSHPGLETDCQRLDQLTGNRFFIITGRELAYVDKLFPNAQFKVASEYCNVVRLNADGPQELNPRPQWELIDAAMDKIVETYEGMVMRKKPFMRTLHYAHAPALQLEAIRNTVEGQLRDLLAEHDRITGHTLSLVDGGQVFDMGPGGLDKGKALEAFLEYLGKSYTGGEPMVPVYCGDSPGDLPAARVAQALGGIFIAVGNDKRVTDVADFVLKDPAEYRALLHALTQPAPTLRPEGPSL